MYEIALGLERMDEVIEKANRVLCKCGNVEGELRVGNESQTGIWCPGEL